MICERPNLTREGTWKVIDHHIIATAKATSIAMTLLPSLSACILDPALDPLLPVPWLNPPPPLPDEGCDELADELPEDPSFEPSPLDPAPETPGMLSGVALGFEESPLGS